MQAKADCVYYIHVYMQRPDTPHNMPLQYDHMRMHDLSLVPLTMAEAAHTRITGGKQQQIRA